MTNIAHNAAETNALSDALAHGFVVQDHLSLAASTGSTEIVEAMLEAGCGLSELDSLGETALHHAARLGLVAIVECLAARGARLDSVNRKGQSPIETADEFGQLEAISALRNLGAAVPPSWRRPRLTETVRFLKFEPLSTETEARLRKRFAGLGELLVPVERAVLRMATLPFYEDCVLVAVEDPIRHGLRERFVLVHDPSNQAICSVLKWSNSEIYEWNERFGINLSDDDVAKTYTEFFFCFVRGSLGRFLFVDSVEDIDWRTEAIDSDRTRVAKHLEPIRVAERTSDFVRLRGIVSFKNALFRTDAVFAIHDGEFALLDKDNAADRKPESFKIGQGKLVNEELLEEDLPVDYPGPPGPYG